MFIDTSVRPQGEADAVTPSRMKLSTAIRIGAKIRPQCQGRYFKEGGSCALGAAFEGLGGKPFDGDPSWQTKQASAELLLKKIYGNNVGGLWLKNDEGESRESIADWLEAQGL